MKAFIYLVGLCVGAVWIGATAVAAVIDWRCGLMVGGLFLAALYCVVRLDGLLAKGQGWTMILCRDVVAYSPNGAAAVCILHLGHPGQCATTLAALQKVGYTQPPF